MSLARPRVLLTRRWPEKPQAELLSRYEATVVEHGLSDAALREAMTRFDAICPTVRDRLCAGTLATPGATVRLVANYGVGYEHVDLDAARHAGIAVTNTPDVLTEATADLAVLLMLMVTRRAGEGERELRAGRWAGWRPTHLMGQSVAGKLFGVVGLGRIGRAAATRARAFGMRIGYTGRARSPTAEAGLEAQWFDTIEALASDADVLSLHCPGGAATRNLVDAALLARMKATAVLVNTARGSIVDEPALAQALRSGAIWGAGLDVFEREPIVHPALLEAPNTVLLPHLGSATLETRSAMAERVLANLDAFFGGREPPDRVA